VLNFIIVTILYFSFSWGLPWDLIPSTISFSYVFDLLFTLVVGFIYHLPWKFKFKVTKEFYKMLGEVVLLACVTIGCLWYFDIEHPFRLVQNLEWQLIILAPILEELVFRQTLQRVFINGVGGKAYTTVIVAVIFAASHLVALRVLPVEYVPFIGFQFFYTFILGLYAGSSLLRFHSVFVPVLIHFIFNLLFYLSLSFDLI